MRRASTIGAVLVALTLTAPAMAEPGDPAKAVLAWNLPWDADWVTTVAFVGPNRLAAGNNRGEILIWELPDKPGGPAPAPVRRLVGHTNSINRLLTTPDGRWLLSASNDRTVRGWDLQAEATGNDVVILNEHAISEATEKKRKAPAPVEAKVGVQSATRVLEGHRDWVLGLSLSRDGGVLVSGDDKGSVIVWDWPAGKEQRRWQVTGWVWALALAPDASSLLVSERRPLVFDSGRHTGLKIWDPKLGEVRHDLGKDFKEKPIFGAAAFAPDGKLLAVGRGGESNGPSGKVTLYDPADGKKVRELSPGHLDGLTDLTFSPDGKYLYSSGRDTLVRAWNVADGKLIKELGQPRGGQFKDWIHAVSVAPDNRWLAAADMLGQVQVWSLQGE